MSPQPPGHGQCRNDHQHERTERQLLGRVCTLDQDQHRARRHHLPELRYEREGRVLRHGYPRSQAKSGQLLL